MINFGIRFDSIGVLDFVSVKAQAFGIYMAVILDWMTERLNILKYLEWIVTHFSVPHQ